MKRVLIGALALLPLVGCSRSRTEIRVIDGREFICTYRDPMIGTDYDLRCEPIPETTRTTP